MGDIMDLDKTLKIKVIGVGGAGNNAISRMIEDNVKGVTYYLMNTETGTLKRAKTKNILQIGLETTKGLGAGANENVGERAANENKEEIEKNYKSDGNFIKYHYNRFVKRGKNNANY